MVSLKVAHGKVGEALGDRVDVEASRTWLERVISRQGVVCCTSHRSATLPLVRTGKDVSPSPPHCLGTLTRFSDGLVCPVIGHRGERCRALRDDKFLYASGESSVEYARGPSNCSLERI